MLIIQVFPALLGLFSVASCAHLSKYRDYSSENDEDRQLLDYLLAMNAENDQDSQMLDYLLDTKAASDDFYQNGDERGVNDDFYLNEDERGAYDDFYQREKDEGGEGDEDLNVLVPRDVTYSFNVGGSQPCKEVFHDYSYENKDREIHPPYQNITCKPVGKTERIEQTRIFWANEKNECLTVEKEHKHLHRTGPNQCWQIATPITIKGGCARYSIPLDNTLGLKAPIKKSRKSKKHFLIS